MAVADKDSKSDDGTNNSDHLAIDVEVVSARLEEDGNEKKVQRIIKSVGKNRAGAGAVKTAGAGTIITAGAGSVTLSGGTVGGSVDTRGAGSVRTYNGVPEAADNEEEEDGAHKLPWAVGVLGGLADGAAIAAAVYKSPVGAAAHGGEVAYRVGLLGVLAAGVAEMVAAFWVSRDNTGRGATGKKILYVAVCTLLVGIMLDGAAIALKK